MSSVDKVVNTRSDIWLCIVHSFIVSLSFAMRIEILLHYQRGEVADFTFIHYSTSLSACFPKIHKHLNSTRRLTGYYGRNVFRRRSLHQLSQNSRHLSFPTIEAMDRSLYLEYLEDLEPYEIEMYNGAPHKGSDFSRYINRQRKLDHLSDIGPREDDNDNVGLLMHNHRPDQLARAIRSYTSMNDKTLVREDGDYVWTGTAFETRQQEAVKKYQNLLPTASNKSVPKNRFKNTHLLEQLEKYYKVLDDIFFFGSLKNLCLLRVKTELNEALGECYHGTKKPSKEISDGFACAIHISAAHDVQEEQRRKNYMFVYVETLLHEMIHAYFRIYTCICTKACRRTSEKMVGNSGHQQSWQEAALVIEESSERLLGHRIDMSRRWSLACDWSETGEVPAWFFEGPTKFRMNPDGLRADYAQKQRQVKGCEIE